MLSRSSTYLSDASLRVLNPRTGTSLNFAIADQISLISSSTKTAEKAGLVAALVIIGSHAPRP